MPPARSPNTFGACSPASHVEWIETDDGLDTRLGGVLIQRHPKGENVGYPTLCKGTFKAGGNTYHAIEDPTSLNAMELLPELAAAGVKALKIEGRQRSPVYVQQVTRVWRRRWTPSSATRRLPPRPEWTAELGKVSEGAQTTLGAYHRPWQ
jgi:collagenase-like PrtC family protease